MIRLLSLLCFFFFGLAMPAAAEDQIAKGRALFFQHCAVCHGQDAGGGNDAGGTPPPDLTRIAGRRGSVWPMLEIMSIIDGYTKATEPREGMPVVPELNQGSQIEFDTGNGLAVLVPANLVAVVSYLESIQRPRPQRYVP